MEVQKGENALYSFVMPHGVSVAEAYDVALQITKTLLDMLQKSAQAVEQQKAAAQAPAPEADKKAE